MTPFSPAILLFVKDPVAGQVKTRLGAEIGMATAARAYRRLAERVVENLPAAYPLRVCFAPVHAEPTVRAWLGPRVAPGTLFLPQSGSGRPRHTVVGETFRAPPEENRHKRLITQTRSSARPRMGDSTCWR